MDRWDERQAAEDENKKIVEPLSVAASLAFRELGDGAGVADLARAANKRVASSAELYSRPANCAYNFRFADGLLAFPSSIVTETAANNTVYARVYESRKRRGAVVVLPHWNAALWAYQAFSRHLRRLGFTVVEVTLPYHGWRSRPSATFSDYFLSANLGRTIRSVRQAVLDTSAVFDWLEARGHERLGLIGLSLGSCVGGLVAAHDSRVSASALILTAGDFAEVVWSGRATRHIRAGLAAANMTLGELQQVWGIISTGTFAKLLARPGHRSLILSGRRDRVVLPQLTARFVRELRQAGGQCVWRELDCGHYSLAMFPFNAISFFRLCNFFAIPRMC
ncbi:MAG TPA: dienelactone hydrolase-related enzyme [Xanthobacteraceae bacterium]|nr:dienelactone hydrolase-related enzyme [Xanthobacteraceae bacterium]